MNIHTKLMRFIFVGCLAFAPQIAVAKEAKIAVSITPLRLIAAALVGDEIEVVQIIPQGQSAHHGALRPSQRQIIEDVSLVFLMHPEFESALTKIAQQNEAQFVSLGDAMPEYVRRLRDWDEDDAHDDHDEHDEHHEDHDDHDDHEGHEGHDEHDDHDDHDEHGDHDEHHEGHEGHEDHDEHDNHHGHAHEGGTDWHLWLSPHAMDEMAHHMAERLGDVFPDKAALFDANYLKASRQIKESEASMKARIENAKPKPFMTAHDATLYLEEDFNLTSAGALLHNIDSRPSAAHLRRLQHKAEEMGVSCLFYEPEFSSKLAKQIAADLGIRAVLFDPLGAMLEADANLADFWSQIEQSFHDCFTAS